MEYGETFLVADDRFSSHQAGLMLHMGLRSLNVTYPTSSPEKKRQQITKNRTFGKIVLLHILR